MQSRRKESRRKYYWLVCQDPETNQPYLIFGGNTEDEARQKGLDVLVGLNFEIRPLATRNLQMASSMVRGKRLDETKSLTEAKKRLGHDRSIKRMRRRRREYGA